MVAITDNMSSPEYTLIWAQSEPLRALMARWQFATGRNAVHDAKNALDSSRRSRKVSLALVVAAVVLAYVAGWLAMHLELFAERMELSYEDARMVGLSTLFGLAALLCVGFALGIWRTRDDKINEFRDWAGGFGYDITWLLRTLELEPTDIHFTDPAELEQPLRDSATKVLRAEAQKVRDAEAEDTCGETDARKRFRAVFVLMERFGLTIPVTNPKDAWKPYFTAA
jgi:hypothetical protein